MGLLLPPILIVAAIVGVCFLVSYIAGKIAKRYPNPVEVYNRLMAEENIKRDEYFAKNVSPMLNTVCQEIYSKFGKPQTALPVDIVNIESEQALQELQRKLPEQWCAWPDHCHCWVNDDILYILESVDSIEFKAKMSPEEYDTPEKVENEMQTVIIPLSNIHYYKEKGELVRGKRTIAPSSVSVSGATVNGVSFGEIETTPELTVPHILDSRYVILYYRKNGNQTLQTLFFSSDSMDSLIRTIPQFEK